MYHHNHHHQGKPSFPSTRMTFPPERHLFMQGGNSHGETGLVLSTDAKPRLKWTSELHECFIEAVNKLGGADKATPKTVMKLMGIPGLTLYHLKSHLQKYRLSKNLRGQPNTGINKNGCTAEMAGDRMSEVNGALTSNTSNGFQPNKSSQISETLQMQIEVQRRLHEQLEVQRHLQLRIEAQGKYLQSVLEKAQETLGRQNLGAVGLEAAKVQLSELVSEVSTECINPTFPGLKEMPGLCPQQTQITQPADCSMDSCLTSCEGSQKDQEMHNFGMGLRPYRGSTPLGTKDLGEDCRLEQTKHTWSEDLNGTNMLSSSLGRDTERIMFPVQRSSRDLSMNVRLQEEKGSGISISSLSDTRPKERDAKDSVHEQKNTGLPIIQVEKENISKGFRLPYLTANLDLNAHDENDANQSCEQFDLNGFSWS